MSEHNHYQIESLGDEATEEELDLITDILNENNTALGFDYNPLPVKVLLKDHQGKVVGGLVGTIIWGWLYIKLLAVAPTARGQGLGIQLLRAAEEHSLKHGCKYAFLDTFSFQARPFYEKNGYEVFGTLDNFSVNCQRFFMRKCLRSDIAGGASGGFFRAAGA
jgi:GNAT superfamily N-acetyltransferase